MSGYENLGPAVSQNPQAVTPGGGDFSADERSYESLVFQQNCPPLDWEFNLFQSIIGNAGLRNVVQRFFSSGFITSDFLSSQAPGSSYVSLTPVAGNENKFKFLANDVVVNGWNLHLEYTNTDVAGENIIELPAPPNTGGRQDLVILEVWRALVSPNSATNKSPAGGIYRFGNAKAPDTSGPLTNVNLSDDLIDPSYGSETSRRVQIQYRFRTFAGVDIIAYSDGLDDPSVDVHTIPYHSSLSVDGATLGGYTWSPHPNDPGLWVAGNGNALSASDIGSVDGYIYAIPICVVGRRNSSPFDKLLNLNGADIIASGSTERPDGYFADQIVVETDLVDLRKTQAYSVDEFRRNSINDLLNNSLRTQYEEDLNFTGGSVLFTKDSTGLASHTGATDNVRMTFSDKPVIQPIPVYVSVAAPTSSIVIDLNSFDLPWLPGVNLFANAPADTEMCQINKAFLNVSLPSNASYNLFDPTSTYFVTSVVYSTTGIGGVDTATINFNMALPVGDFYAEVLVEYKFGYGLSRNLLSGLQVWAPSTVPVWADPANFVALTDATRVNVQNYFGFNANNRELSIAYPTQPTISTFYSINTKEFMIPDMVDFSSISLGGGLSVAGMQSNAGCTIISVNPPVAPGTAISVAYAALRPPPAFPLDSLDIYYQSSAIQSIKVPSGSVTVDLVKRTENDRFIAVNCSSGSYTPYTNDGCSQIPIPYTPTSSYSDASISGYHEINTKLAKSTTGIANLPLVSVTREPAGNFFIKTDGLATTQDANGRNFWPFSSVSSLLSSDLNEYATAIKRKLISDFIVELKTDVPGYGRKGTLFLATFVGYRESSTRNFITTDSLSPTDGVSLFRLRGNPIYFRRTP